MLQQLKAPKLPFRELDVLVKAIGECRSKAEEDRIIGAEVDTLKQRLSDPKLDKTRGREYMVRVIYCEMLGHDASFAYIPALQLASDPNLLTKKVSSRLHPEHSTVMTPGQSNSAFPVYGHRTVQRMLAMQLHHASYLAAHILTSIA